MVTGTLAIWLQAKPDLTPDEVREILSRTAIQDEYTGNTSNNTWGYGKLDAWNGLKEILGLSSLQSHNEDNKERAILICRGGDCSLLITADIENAAILIYDISGREVANIPKGDVAAGDEIILPQLSSGLYIVTIKGKEYCNSFKFSSY